MGPLQKAGRNLKCVLYMLMCAIVAVGIAVPVCLAQQYSFSEVTAGMDDLNVNCIAQDRSDFLWVGTENGLYRYDGNRIRKFGAADGLNARTIQSLFLGPDGTLFVGTTSGIYFRLRSGRFSEIAAPAPLNHFFQRIGTVFSAEAPDRIIAAARSGAYELRRISSGNWVATPLHLPGGAIWSVLYAPDGVLWYGCGSDLCRMAGGKAIEMRGGLHLPEDQWLHLLLRSNGRLWIRGGSHLGEVIPAEERYEEHDLPLPYDNSPYAALTQDKRGDILASQGSFLGLWKDGAWRLVTRRNGLPRFDLSALFVDREGSLWVGMVGHGLSRWVGRGQWEAYTVSDGLSDNIVWGALRDHMGRLWIATEGGLDWIPAGQTAARPWRDGGIPTVRADTLAESANGNVWIGSAAGRLIRINEKTLAGETWKVPEVYRILTDKQNLLWAATDGGLYVGVADGADPSLHLVKAAVFVNPKMRFTDLCPDTSNRLWVASDQGLFRLDANGWRRINPGVPGVNPSLIAMDRKGNLWAAGNFAGIRRLRIAGGRVVASESITRPRLLSDQVVSLYLDHRGWMWVGQDTGLTVFNGRFWHSFTQDDGLIWNDLDLDALSEDRDGSMWIGTSGGLSHLIEPEAVIATQLRAPLISRMTFGTTDVANGSRIPWSASPLSVSIAVLNFRNAAHIHIRYRLLGLDSDWAETSEESVRYPRLNPGAYRFQAEAVDAIGSAISGVEEVDFRITPRWWQSWELHLGFVLLACLGLLLAWRWRIHLLVRQKRELERAIKLRTDDLEREKAELLHAREQMRHFAEHDDLTSLWNHRIILQRLYREVDRSRRENSPLSVILTDLDHFKKINDTFGHRCGDRVLKEIGAILQRSVRSYDWVGRYGGEEFLLILPGSTLASAQVRAEELRRAVENARILDGDQTIRITASFGVVSGSPTDYDSLIRIADAALYRAKDNGRNCVVAMEIDTAEDPTAPQQTSA